MGVRSARKPSGLVLVGLVAVLEFFGVLQVLLCHCGGFGFQLIFEAAALCYDGHVDGGCRVQLDGQPLPMSAGSFDAAPAPCAVSPNRQLAVWQNSSAYVKALSSTHRPVGKLLTSKSIARPD